MYPIKILIVIIFTAILAVVLKRVINKILLQEKMQEGLKTFLLSLSPVSNLLIWGLGILIAMQMATHEYHFPITEQLLKNARELFLIFLSTWLLLSWKSKYEALLISRLKEGKSKFTDSSIISGIGKVTTIIILIFSSMIVLQILGFDYTAIIAFGGVGGIAVGFAAKDVIANFFGGLMIHLNHPFSIGDLVKSTNKNFEGFVEQIGWYMTRLRSLERRPVYIPNALMTDAIIENAGRMYNRRIRQVFGVRYCDMPLVHQLIDSIKKMLEEHPEVLKNQISMVHLVAFNTYSVDIEIYCFTRKLPLIEFRDIQQDVLFKVSKIITDHGAEMAYPTQSIYLSKSSPETP